MLLVLLRVDSICGMCVDHVLSQVWLRRCEGSEIPPTGVGGLFRSSINREQTLMNPYNLSLDCSRPTNLFVR